MEEGRVTDGETKEEDQKSVNVNGAITPAVSISIPPALLLHNRREKRLLDFLKAKPLFEKIGVSFVRNIDRESLLGHFKDWISHPLNIAQLIWVFLVASCLVFLLLLMAGLLRNAIPEDSDRRKWKEILNQILNSLFTVMCLYQHPRICHHSVQLYQWRSGGISELRSVYCNNGAERPRDRAHMVFVVMLLQITCFSQYALCALHWVYDDLIRPDWPQILLIAIGTGAPVIAGLYTVLSPLGSPEEPAQMKPEEEDDVQEGKNGGEGLSWAGGIFDCWDDPTVYWHSLLCPFYVFGWNMERLGFGNMYVHIVTLTLLCCSPVIVFGVASLKIMDYSMMRYAVGIAGVLLCWFGALYGGYWRTKMRKRFKIEGMSVFMDFVLWMFCWPCALAQEVRTGNFYDAEREMFCEKEREEEEGEGRREQMPPMIPRMIPTKIDQKEDERNDQNGEESGGISTLVFNNRLPNYSK